jgi:hypothetical protein
MGISTASALEARLVSLRSRPAGEDAFLAEVQALGASLQVRIGSDSLLKIALAGLSSDGVSPPSGGPAAGFAGRSVVLPTISSAALGEDDGAEVEKLLISCAATVEAEGNQAELRDIYVAMLARPDVRRDLGASRPVDLHVLSALTAERASVSALSPVTFDVDVEVALYGWMCTTVGVPHASEHVTEVTSRRDLRLQLQDRPVAVAAAQLCELPVGHLLPFEGPADTLVDRPLPPDDLVRVVDELAQGSTSWTLRRQGFQLGCATGGEDAGAMPYVMSGRALRWLVDHGVPLGPQRVGRIDDYTKSVTEMLGRGDDTDPLGAHLNVVVGLADDGIHLPLAEELAALAWLCDVHDEYVDLEALLDIRDKGLRGMFG